MKFLSLLPLLTRLALASVASPRHEQEQAQHQQPRHPQITPAAAPTPTTTLSHIHSTTITAISFVQWINERRLTWITASTVTTLEPYPLPTIPTTVLLSVISHVTIEGHTTYLYSGGVSSETTTYAGSTLETWAVWPPKPTHLPARTSNERPRPLCEEQENERKKGEENGVCKAEGLKTGCMGQCLLRNKERDGGKGEWWCYVLRRRDYGDGARMMGRACWGLDDGRLRQVNEPCVDGDGPVGCFTSTWGWSPKKWEGYWADP